LLPALLLGREKIPSLPLKLPLPRVSRVHLLALRVRQPEVDKVPLASSMGRKEAK
jgi:hypothetical protein